MNAADRPISSAVFRIDYGWHGRRQLSASTWPTHEDARIVAAGMACPARVVESRGEAIEDPEADDADARDAFDEAEADWSEDE